MGKEKKIQIIKRDKSNYQSVSTLPILSEVYEKCLYKQIENYLENILSIFNMVMHKNVLKA